MSVAAIANLRALIVDDNAPMRHLLRRLISSIGIRDIQEASDGDGALVLLREHKSDLVLSDLSMKPMDGIAFTKAVRLAEGSPNPFVPIIMITGHTEKALVEAARDAGVTEILAKPITAQSLFTRITEIVERPRPFVRCANYFGPDRRRRAKPGYAGPWRRQDDQKDIGVVDGKTS